eukprot:gene3751-2647_t
MDGQCSHPASALFVDREHGSTICTLCESVIDMPVYELDPQFPRGASGSGGGMNRGAGGSAPASFRPTRNAMYTDASRPRPSMENARRVMSNIARELEINDDIVEMALAIYKLGVNMNVISGTRNSVVCACLYAVCRRERTSHVIYDFAATGGVTPAAILSNMHHICRATHTEVPVVDPSCMVQRFAEYLNLGNALPQVLVCALKLLRAMQEDWISCGRRPMGVCAASLIAACCILGIPRTPEQICGIVRLTAATITKRLTEFSNTPAAELVSIDAYSPTNTTLPPSFSDRSQLTVDEDMNAEYRDMAAMYFQLVGEAKVSAPNTPERCQRWRQFIAEHCRQQNIEVTESDLDLRGLTPEKQLIILGLPHTKPIPPEEVESSVKREEDRLLKQHSKEEASDAANNSGEMKWSHPASNNSSSTAMMMMMGNAAPGGAVGHNGSLLPVYSSDVAVNLDDPSQVAALFQEYESAKALAEIEGLRQDFDFADEMQNNNQMTQNEMGVEDDDQQPMHSPAPLYPEALTEKEALAELLWDRDRRHALPWEILVLPSVEADDTRDLLPYIILDNEERIRRHKIGEALYRNKWSRGRAKTEEELQSRRRQAQVKGKLRPRRVIDRPVGVVTAMERLLKQSGGFGSVLVSGIAELVPEMEDGGDGQEEEDWVD